MNATSIAQPQQGGKSGEGKQQQANDQARKPQAGDAAEAVIRQQGGASVTFTDWAAI